MTSCARSEKPVAQFKEFLMEIDARAPDVPRYLKNLHKVERDILGVTPSDIELPPECLPD